MRPYTAPVVNSQTIMTSQLQPSSQAALPHVLAVDLDRVLHRLVDQHGRVGDREGAVAGGEVELAELRALADHHPDPARQRATGGSGLELWKSDGSSAGANSRVRERPSIRITSYSDTRSNPDVSR